MGFYPQSNKWQCGPFALKHALAILGRFEDEATLTKAAKTTREGTDEKMLARAAERCDCELVEIRRYDEEGAFKSLTSHLNRGLPCLICINQWGHWVTIVGYDQRKQRFVVIDSEKDPVVRVPSWSELKRRWVYTENDEEGETKQYFDLYPLKPHFRLRTKANFSTQRAQFLRRPGNASFVAHFDEYVSDMLIIARPRNRRRLSNNISMAEFLRRHRQMLVEMVSYWHGITTEAQLRRILKNMQFVAETYALVIPADEEKRTIASISALLMTWATTHDPVNPIYD